MLGNELFSDIFSGRIARHAAIRQRDVRRIEYTGQLCMQNMSAGIRPGDPVSVEGRNTIPTFSIVRTVTFDCNEQVMLVDLANADLRKIYDAPQHNSAQSFVASSGGGASVESGYTSSGGPSTGSPSTRTSASGGDYERSSSGGGEGTGRQSNTNKMPDAGAESGTPRKAGKIISGEALERADAATAAMGDPEHGIFTEEQSKAGDDELKARHYGSGAPKSDYNNNDTGGIAEDRMTPQERRRKRTRG